MEITRGHGAALIFFLQIILVLPALYFFADTTAIIVSAILLVAVSAAIVTMFLSILYKKMGKRSVLSISLVATTSLCSILVLFANLYRWLGLKDTVRDASPLPFPFLDAVYFSVVTWTTLGYGDIVALPASRVVAALEALLGYLVMALLIAVLIPMIQQISSRKGN